LAISIVNEGRARISKTTIINNRTDGRGGGILDSPMTPGGNADHASLLIIDCTIAGNEAGAGGGIWTNGSLIVQSTISGNTAVVGGGVHGNGTVLRSTIAFNDSTSTGGGIFTPGGILTIRSSIVAENSAPEGRDLTGLIGSQFDVMHNLIGSNQHSGLLETPLGTMDTNGNQIGGPNVSTRIFPHLAPLADNGGPTMTHALLPNSPAINAGDPNAVLGEGGVPFHDGRGAPFLRVYGGRIDIGAFEVQPNVLWGDYNGDGFVNAADFTLWRNTTGMSVPAGTGADGNTDGLIDGRDYDVWKANYGSTTDDLGPVAGTIAIQDVAAAAFEALMATKEVTEVNPSSSAARAALATLDVRPAVNQPLRTHAPVPRATPYAVRNEQALPALLETGVTAERAKTGLLVNERIFEPLQHRQAGRDAIRAVDDAFASVASDWRRL
jgi:hypothetical protein